MAKRSRFGSFPLYVVGIVLVCGAAPVVCGCGTDMGVGRPQSVAGSAGRCPGARAGLQLVETADTGTEGAADLKLRRDTRA